jgi:hypothetical protein
MQTWHFVTAANLMIAGAYLAISYIIMSGLAATGQLRSNKLGLATGLIFLTCGVHHGSHGVHMLLPAIGVEEGHGLAMRHAWDWHAAIWDALTAAVAIYYLSLRGSYASVLRGAQMFEDMKVRQRQAIEINDNIVQGLTVAKYELELGDNSGGRDAIEDTLRKARNLITDLLGDSSSEAELRSGALRRTSEASVTDGGSSPP